MKTQAMFVLLLSSLPTLACGPADTAIGFSVAGLSDGVKAAGIRFHQTDVLCDQVTGRKDGVEARRFALQKGYGGCVEASAGKDLKVDGIVPGPYRVSVTTFGATGGFVQACEDYVASGPVLDFGCSDVTIVEGQKSSVVVTVRAL